MDDKSKEEIEVLKAENNKLKKQLEYALHMLDDIRKKENASILSGWTKEDLYEEIEKINTFASAAGLDMDSAKKHRKPADVYGNLHQELKALVETAHELHNICFEKIRSCYEDKEISLPIDIEMVAEKLGIKVEYGNLNFAEKRKIDQNIAQLNYEVSGDTVKKKIIVDNSTSRKKIGALSNLEKYAVAYELGKFIMGNEEKIKPERVRRLNLESRPYSLPRLSARLENFEYEMCAIFLLLPMEQFFKEFQSYLNEIKEHPVLIDQWIKHLGEKADIHNYQLVNGYQYIKFSAYRYYEMHLSKKKVRGENFRDLYNV